MKKKIILLSCCVFLFFFQNNLINAEIKNRIIVKIDDEIISSYEMKNKIITTLFLTNQEINQNNINTARNEALRSLIDYKLKNIELKKKNYLLKNNNNVKNYFKEQASKYNTDLIGLKEIYKANFLNFNIYEEEVKIEYAWQQLIYDLYKNKVNFDEDEINKELDTIIKNKKNIEEYELAEIEFSDKNKVKEIQDQIKLIGFENAAIKFSVASSSMNGGNLGWLSSSSLSVKILNLVKNMKINEISKPIIQPNSVTLLKLKNKKILDVKKIDMLKTRNVIINIKTNELLNLFSNSYLSKIKNQAIIEYR